MPPETAPEEEEIESAESAESPAMRFLPRDEDIDGWRLTTDPRVYIGPAVRRWLAGGAAPFLDYGLVDLTVGRYESEVGNKVATVELFRFPDFVQAFGAWTEQRGGRSESVELGNSAFTTNGSIQVWKGPFFIRVIELAAPSSGPASDSGAQTVADSDDSTDETEPAAEGSIETLTRVVLEDIPAAQGMPAVLGFLPSSHRIPGSEKYSIREGLGHTFLGNSFTVDYALPSGGRVTGLALPSPGKEVATQILEAYESFFERNGRVLDAVPNLGEDNFTAEDQYRGRVVALRIDRFVVIFQGFAEMPELQTLAIESDRRILDAIRRALARAEEERRERS